MPSAHPSLEIERERDEREAREKRLKSEMSDIRAELERKKNDLIDVAADIKDNETELLQLEQDIAEKRQRQLDIEVRLDKDRGALSELILAMQRIERVPPEALIARPGAPLETAQSAMLLRNILPRLNKQAEELNNNLEELTKIIASLEEDREAALKTAKKLERNRTTLTGLLKERESLYARTEQDIASNKAELERISAQAKNLRELVARIEKKQQEEEARRQRQAELKKEAVVQTPVPRSGVAQVPLAGMIRTGYGKSDDIGAISKGIRIDGRSNAMVVAPMGGVVDFAGPFKGYGQIIIIRHEDEYHSLVAGLARIDTVVGRAVSAGEPIGQMAAEPAEDGNALYYELRHRGQPDNPAKKIPGL
jgi:septal ring factor EnvC (AmiA/AmiB activator)